MPYNFFQNKDCEYFPCHKCKEEKKDKFNCLFCFCPLYCMPDCGGNYSILSNGKKDCKECIIPHFHYDHIISKLDHKE